jgi:hypothetical protein
MLRVRPTAGYSGCNFIAVGGIGEFFEWNQKENWEAARKALHEYPAPGYYRFEFSERKNNDQPFHTLIPSFVLQKILDATNDFPLRTEGGQAINHGNYGNSKACVDSVFKTALKRSGINVSGHLSPHDFRDVFRTEATIQGVDFEAREFALGHGIDTRGYDKCYGDLHWLWGELEKIYKRNAVQSENKELREAFAELKKRVDAWEPAVRLRGLTDGS